MKSQVLQKQSDQKSSYDSHSKFHTFAIGQNVLARNLWGEPTWLPGHVVEQTGPVSYRVQVADYLWWRHVDQLLDSKFSEQQQVPDSSNITVFATTKPPKIPVPVSMTNTASST